MPYAIVATLWLVILPLRHIALFMNFLAMVLRPVVADEWLISSITALSHGRHHFAWLNDRVSTLNAILCSCSYNAVQYPTLTSLDCSPACLLHTRDVARKSVQTELELRVMVSIRSLAHSLTLMSVAMTDSCHAEVSEDTATLCAHDTAVLDLRRASVAVHLGELELRLRARALRQRGVADNIAKRLPVRLIQSVCNCFTSPGERAL